MLGGLSAGIFQSVMEIKILLAMDPGYPPHPWPTRGFRDDERGYSSSA